MQEADETTPAAYVAPPVEVARLDRDGAIVSVNREWELFCLANGGDPDRCGPGVSYLEVCDAAGGDPVSAAVGDSIRAALAGDLARPSGVTMACDRPGEPRLYDVAIYPRVDDFGAPLGVTVALWRSAAPLTSTDPAGSPAGGVLPLLRESSRAIDALWRGASSGDPTPSAIHLGEASQGVHRALIALAGSDVDDPIAPAPPGGVVMSVADLDRAVQHLSRTSLELHHASLHVDGGSVALHLQAAVAELDQVLQDLRHLAFSGAG